MLQKKSKKIFIYLFVFLIIGTINNKDINKINFTKISKITVSGLDNKNNFELLNSLNYLKVSNLFFIDQHKIERVVEANLDVLDGGEVDVQPAALVPIVCLHEASG